MSTDHIEQFKLYISLVHRLLNGVQLDVYDYKQPWHAPAYDSYSTCLVEDDKASKVDKVVYSMFVEVNKARKYPTKTGSKIISPNELVFEFIGMQQISKDIAVYDYSIVFLETVKIPLECQGLVYNLLRDNVFYSDEEFNKHKTLLPAETVNALTLSISKGLDCYDVA